VACANVPAKVRLGPPRVGCHAVVGGADLVGVGKVEREVAEAVAGGRGGELVERLRAGLVAPRAPRRGPGACGARGSNASGSVAVWLCGCAVTAPATDGDGDGD